MKDNQRKRGEQIELFLFVVDYFHVALGGSDALVRHVALDSTDISTRCSLKGRICPAV